MQQEGRNIENSNNKKSCKGNGMFCHLPVPYISVIKVMLSDGILTIPYNAKTKNIIRNQSLYIIRK